MIPSEAPKLGAKKSTLARAITFVSDRTPKLAKPALSSKSSVTLRRFISSAITGEKKDGLSTFGATYTVVNTFVGLGLLSKPYAVQQGGLVSILWLAIICLVANYSGKVIIKCFKNPKLARAGSYSNVPTDYPTLGKVALGNGGLWAVRIFVVLEFVGSCVTCLVLLARNAYLLVQEIEGVGVMTDSNRSEYKLWLFLGCLTIVTPTVWMLNFRELWFLSLLGSTCSCLVSVTVIGCFVKAAIEGRAADVSTLDVSGDSNDTMVALGIFILSMAGHAALPGVYSQMKRPQDFNRMLDMSFFAIFLVYAVVALSGYWTYGENAQVVVTDNLKEWPGGFAFYLVTVFVCMQIWSCISGCVQILCEIPEDLMFGENSSKSFDDDDDTLYRELDADVEEEEKYTDVDEEHDLCNATSSRGRVRSSPPSPSMRKLASRESVASAAPHFWTVANKLRLFRTLILWCLLGPISFVCYGNLRLALVEAVTGAFCTMMTSLVLPTAILCALFGIRKASCTLDDASGPWHMGALFWYFNASLAVLGVVFGGYMTYGDFSKTLE